MKKEKLLCFTQFIICGDAVTFAFVPLHHTHQASRFEVTHPDLPKRLITMVVEVSCVVAHCNGMQSAHQEVASAYIQTGFVATLYTTAIQLLRKQRGKSISGSSKCSLHIKQQDRYFKHLLFLCIHLNSDSYKITEETNRQTDLWFIKIYFTATVCSLHINQQDHGHSRVRFVVVVVFAPNSENYNITDGIKEFQPK